MYVLGVNPGWHDGSAALLKDGQLVTLVELDRVSRTKNAMAERPAGAILACLQAAGITLDDVEVVAVGWNEPVTMKQNGVVYDPDEYRRALLPPELFPHTKAPPIQFVSHHLAHAASGMWTSGFERAAVLVIDGRGDTQATSLWVGGQDTLECIQEWDVSQSLGNFYGEAADWAGFSFWGPGKLMGLASYGRAMPSSALVTNESGYWFDGTAAPTSDVKLQARRQRALLKEHFKTHYPYSPGDVGDIMAHAHFAASIQGAVEAAVFSLARIAKSRVGSEDLVITGGVGLNCTMNGRLALSGMFRDLYIPPVTFDSGVSLGAALVADRERVPDRPPMSRMDHAYWGRRSDAAEVERAIQDSGFSAVKLSEDALVSRVADHIADGRVVGWFQGRAEIGQRALGARSMLCDPRSRQRLVRVNQVKGREVWRPLAPSVLEEYSHELFDGGLPSLTDFMLAALPVRESARPLVPATTHVDGSARPQRVRRATNPRYWRLIDTFRERTGVPAVMNTSFNLAGEPIVHTADDAISAFRRSEMDVLALEDYLIEKPGLASD